MFACQAATTAGKPSGETGTESHGEAPVLHENKAIKTIDWNLRECLEMLPGDRPFTSAGGWNVDTMTSRMLNIPNISPITRCDKFAIPFGGGAQTDQ